MTFNMYLSGFAEATPITDWTYDPEDDPAPSPFEVPEDYFSKVISACELLGTSTCHFNVSGFGLDPWPVSVAYDLSTVMEEFPDFLTGFRAAVPVELDFYAPGIERLLKFTPTDGRVAIKCTSRTSWKPDPELEMIERNNLEKMLVDLASNFARAVATVIPAYAETEPFASWNRGIV